MRLKFPLALGFGVAVLSSGCVIGFSTTDNQISIGAAVMVLASFFLIGFSVEYR